MKNKTRVLIWGVIVLALAIRLYFWSLRGCIQTDSVQYLGMAHNLIYKGLSGLKGLFTGRPFGYSLPIALLNFFGIELEKSGYLVSILAGSILILPVALMARCWYGVKAAIWVSILIAVHPFLIEASCDVLPTSLYSLLVITAIYWGWKALEKGKRRDYILTAILWGYAYFTRIEGITYPLIWLVFYFCLRKWRKEQGRVREGRNFILALIVIAIFLFSYMSAYRYTTGNWSLGGRTTQKASFIITANQSHDPERTASLNKDITNFGLLKCLWFQKEVVFTHYLRWLNQEWIFLLPQIITLPMAGLAFLGLFGRPWDRKRFKREVYLLTMLHPLLIYPYLIVRTRYLLPTSLIILVWVANGIVEILEWAKKIGKKRSEFVLAIVGGILGFTLIVKFTQPIREAPYFRYWREHKQMGLWMAENFPLGLNIMSRRPYVAFYARGNHILLPDREIEEVLEMARAKGADYLIIDERSMHSYKSVTLRASLKNGEQFGLKKIHHLDPEEGYRIVLYKIKDF